MVVSENVQAEMAEPHFTSGGFGHFQDRVAVTQAAVGGDDFDIEQPGRSESAIGCFAHPEPTDPLLGLFVNHPSQQVIGSIGALWEKGLEGGRGPGGGPPPRSKYPLELCRERRKRRYGCASFRGSRR